MPDGDRQGSKQSSTVCRLVPFRSFRVEIANSLHFQFSIINENNSIIISPGWYKAVMQQP